ncbi:hypothetical protein Fmac_027703 [Flemingia macrophylla]|uniref:Uncharacterized protein n=1 Tax=Flemingia macrophylla TaxID=520843 RepID=A0ABD1LIH2_9FABA
MAVLNKVDSGQITAFRYHDFHILKIRLFTIPFLSLFELILLNKCVAVSDCNLFSFG